MISQVSLYPANSSVARDLVSAHILRRRGRSNFRAYAFDSVYDEVKKNT